MNHISHKAQGLVELALGPLIQSGAPIERLALIVSQKSEIVQHQSMETQFGTLRIEPGIYVPKGLAYIIEDPGRRGRVFAWVIRKQRRR
ncbi:hypothetical protein ACIFOE_22225 [Paenibacillus sp. NRS-1783]|uniref:hypothetical protein n=1 Tax=Paenibacillus sp. NRS-1783 TaxID=3233907 RepID=UPI003D27ADBD